MSSWSHTQIGRGDPVGGSAMTARGQSRHFYHGPATSGLPRLTDIVIPTQHVQLVPHSDRTRSSSWRFRHDRSGSIASFLPWASHFRSTPINGHRHTDSACPVGPTLGNRRRVVLIQACRRDEEETL